MKARQLASGIALLFETRELARHSDIRMTRRYTRFSADLPTRLVAPEKYRLWSVLMLPNICGIRYMSLFGDMLVDFGGRDEVD